MRQMNRRAFLAGLGLAPIAAYVAPAAPDRRQAETPYYLIGEVNGATGAVVFTGVRQFKFVV